MPVPAPRKRPAVTVRMARSDEGPTIRDLYMRSGKLTLRDVDWTVNIAPYWLLAEANHRPIGAIQVCAGVPVGRIELLCLPRELPKRLRIQAIIMLLGTALETCRRVGCQFVSGWIDGPRDWGHLNPERYGWVKWFEGTAYITRT